MKLRFSIFTLLAALSLSGCQSAQDKDTALIAVATNFRTTFEKLETVFEQETDFDITQVNGATGSIYTQIINGAPYHVFLSADTARPEALEAAGLGSHRFIYAQGRLVLWSASQEAIARPLAELLSDAAVRPVAIANPALAPYGKAAQDVFERLGADMNDRVVMGENVGQAFALVQSGNAPIGFVAKADAQRFEGGHYSEIDPALYAPIKQEAVLLLRGQDHAAALAFHAFLKSPKAQSMILADGYVRGGDAL